MPELPEVESVRRTLAAHLCGRRIHAVDLRRPDIVHGSATPQALLKNQTVTRVDRRGKQLALVADTGRVVCIHLGMSGSVRYETLPQPIGSGQTPFDPSEKRNRHAHMLWQLSDTEFVVHRDPRRFGGLWTCRTFEALLAERWAELGPDALTIQPVDLLGRLSCTARPLKAALLDQQLVAGLGNIYVDEALYAARLSPLTPADRLSLPPVQRLVRQMRRILNAAIRSGGSTLRDYVDGNGRAGQFQLRHLVYGRSGEDCPQCRTPFTTTRVTGRTTVFCPQCQNSTAPN